MLNIMLLTFVCFERLVNVQLDKKCHLFIDIVANSEISLKKFMFEIHRSQVELTLFFMLDPKSSATIVQIEELEPPTEGLPKSTKDEIIKMLTKKNRFYCTSIDQDYVNYGNNSVFQGFISAYKRHYPFTLSPDIVWLLILQGFSRHINNNSEKFRSSFVDFQGKKELCVDRTDLTPSTATVEDWMSIFSEINEKISDNIPRDLIEGITPNFTTTTPVSLSTCQLTIMATFKNYFDYSCMMCSCGIPYVTIEGTIGDWENLEEKLNFIEKYEMEWWTSKLKPVITEIINTKKGKVNKEFWKNMVRVKNGHGIYDPGYYDGWFTVFFPYDKDNEKLSLDKISTRAEIAEEIVDIPFKIKFPDGDSMPMKISAGFVGLSQDPNTFQLKPEMGWLMTHDAKGKRSFDNDFRL